MGEEPAVAVMVEARLVLNQVVELLVMVRVGGVVIMSTVVFADEESVPVATTVTVAALVGNDPRFAEKEALPVLVAVLAVFLKEN